MTKKHVFLIYNSKERAPEPGSNFVDLYPWLGSNGARVARLRRVFGFLEGGRKSALIKGSHYGRPESGFGGGFGRFWPLLWFFAGFLRARGEFARWGALLRVCRCFVRKPGFP